MKTKATYKPLHSALENKKDEKRKDALENVLKKLKKKQSKLKGKIAESKNDKRKKFLAAKLKVNRAHLKKCEKALAKIDD
ncbi:MAG: hypothetical protein HN403_08765 [Rhodospirillales bacterium]|jgi:hypothetical protein|nr:hypothetical protein [Rhodospirillales bacterium]